MDTCKETKDGNTTVTTVLLQIDQGQGRQDHIEPSSAGGDENARMALLTTSTL